MKLVKLFLSLLMLLTFTEMRAQQVSVDEAMSRAKAFLKTSGVRRAPSQNTSVTADLQLAYTCNSTNDEKVCFYVFNRGTDGGFIIMGGDEAAQEVLAYSDSGSFDYATAPENFKWWLSQYQQQISEAIDYAEAYPEVVASAKAKAKAARKAATNVRNDISPLVQTKWNQTSPYNSALPSLGDGYKPLVTGCVATAMAQIMKFHNYPETGVGSNSYTQKWSNVGTITFSADFANTTYDWGSMTNTYDSSSTTDETNAVATLMYHCGVAVNMKYGQSSSSASSVNATTSLCDNFRYSPAIRNEYRKYYSDEAWEQLIYNELAKDRPILYGGQTTDSIGHAFVCDGYSSSDNYYHMNWGWGGSYDCYVQLTGSDAIKPGGTGTGGAGEKAAYDQSQHAVINIIGSAEGLETPQLRNSTGSITLYNGSTAVTSYEHVHGTAKTLKLTERVANSSRTLTSFTLGVKATDEATGVVHYFSDTSKKELTIGYGINYSLSFDVNEIPYNGTYTIKMVGRNVNSSSEDDWYDVGIETSVTLPTVTITGAEDPDVAKKSAYISLANKDLILGSQETISITSGYDGTPSFLSSNTAVATVTDGVITAVSEGKTTITVTLPETDNYNGKTVSYDVSVMPADFVISKTPYFEDANPWANNQTLKIPFFNGTSDDFSGNYYVQVKYKGSSMIYTCPLSLGTGQSKVGEITLDECLTGMQKNPGTSYEIWFFKDQARTQPFNIASISYIYQDYLAGDVNLDNQLTDIDVTGMQNIIMSKQESVKNADFDSDGKVNIVDVTKLIEFLKNRE